jgi:DNA-binding NtrC family response regulator
MDPRMNIMIVDDERIVRESLFHWFAKLGHTVEKASSGFEALELLEKSAFDVLFVDIRMPEMNGIELLEKVKTEYPETVVIIITAYGSIESAVNAMQLGASDYLLKPFKPDYLSLVMEKVAQQVKLASERDYLRGRLAKITRFDDIIGQGPAMQKIFDLILEVAHSDASVLLTGETGTGKELVAKAINCGAIPDSLLESELFGHQKGAFTGATHSRRGLLEVVTGGTLFLDEIGEVSAKMQIDLLRVLDENKIRRIGNSHSVTVDFRLISATRRNLEHEIAAGNFREDFFYRINVITIHLPPLRERKEDIPLLIRHFLGKYSQETTKRVDHITRDTIERLIEYEWPGNVRELENAVERAVVLARSRTLDIQDFSFLQRTPAMFSKPMSLRDMEKQYIRRVLEECGWNVTKAAKMLNINRVTLHKKIKRFAIQKA